MSGKTYALASMVMDMSSSMSRNICGGIAKGRAMATRCAVFRQTTFSVLLKASVLFVEILRNEVQAILGQLFLLKIDHHAINTMRVESDSKTRKTRNVHHALHRLLCSSKQAVSVRRQVLNSTFLAC